MHILVLRFSAMGDVALVLPAVVSLLQQNEELEITFVSRSFFAPIFEGNNRLHFVGADVKGKHKGLKGLLRLSSELHKKTKFDAVVDLHGLLRSRIVTGYFRAKGIQTVTFDKGRSEKKEVLKSRKLRPLLHSTQRYLNAFSKFGLKNELLNGPYYLPKKVKEAEAVLLSKKLGSDFNLIGIAPFAQHSSKEWPLIKVRELIAELTQNPKNRVLLFGGGEEEVAKLAEIEDENPRCFSLAGKFPLGVELSVICKLNVMVSMDSANMHLATLCGTPVVSIWGPTHHYLGFGPLNNAQNIVEVPVTELPCRPCSVFGNLKTQAEKDCAKKAMDGISVKMVLAKVLSVLKND